MLAIKKHGKLKLKVYGVRNSFQNLYSKNPESKYILNLVLAPI